MCSCSGSSPFIGCMFVQSIGGHGFIRFIRLITDAPPRSVALHIVILKVSPFVGLNLTVHCKHCIPSLVSTHRAAALLARGDSSEKGRKNLLTIQYSFPRETFQWLTSILFESKKRNITMPTLKERKYPEPSTSARGSGNGANVARARELPQPEPEPQQRHQRQVSQQPAPQASRQAGDGQALEQQGVVDAMVEMQNHEADLGLPPGGPLQVEPWPPLLVGTGQRANPPSVLVQQLPPPPPPQQQQQQQQQPSRETLLLSIARMERCSRCHLRTWSFVQDPLTGGELSFKSISIHLFIQCPSFSSHPFFLP